ncbi:MAG: copper resistance protein NlpE N-terminal domain-containing protein [Fidelibacterota bacterium]
MKIFFRHLSFICLLFTACSTNNTALSRTGFSNVIPCASCPGIEYTLILMQADSSYIEKMIYLENEKDIFIRNGRFSMSNGRNICLCDKEPAEGMRFFLYDENHLKMLDRHGNPVKGGLAEKYILEKKRSPIRSKSEIRSFTARGNEPFWSLDLVSGSTLAFRTLDTAEHDIILDLPDLPFPSGTDSMHYTINHKKGEIRFYITQRSCTDSMSGEAFDYQVGIQIKNMDNSTAKYTGCGAFYTGDKGRPQDRKK